MKHILVFIVSLIGTKSSVSTTHSPPEKKFPEYSDVALDNIRIGAEGIVRASTDEDILVFIGNSASYFYHAVKSVRRSFLVPSSNLHYTSEPREYLEYKAEHYDLYSSVFLEPIRSEARSHGRNIVLVDYSVRGRSVDVFNAILGMEAQTEFIHLAADHQFPLNARSPKHTKTRTVVVLPASVMALADGVYRRLSPSFGKEKWGESSPELLTTYEQIEAVAADIARIPPVVLPLPELAPMTRPVNIKNMTDRFREIEDEPSPSTWSEGISMDLSFFIDRFQNLLGFFLKQVPSISPRKILDLIRMKPPKELSSDIDNEEIAYELCDIYEDMHTGGGVAVVYHGKRVVTLMLVNQELFDSLAVSFAKTIVGLPVPSELEAEFHLVTGLTALQQSTSPEWFQNAITETTTPAFTL
jgi:hypothetical protein